MSEKKRFYFLTTFFDQYLLKCRKNNVEHTMLVNI